MKREKEKKETEKQKEKVNKQKRNLLLTTRSTLSQLNKSVMKTNVPRLNSRNRTK